MLEHLEPLYIQPLLNFLLHLGTPDTKTYGFIKLSHGSFAPSFELSLIVADRFSSKQSVVIEPRRFGHPARNIVDKFLHLMIHFKLQRHLNRHRRVHIWTDVEFKAVIYTSNAFKNL